MNSQQRRESLRTAVLEWLAIRPSLAHELDVIMGRLNRSGFIDFEAEKEEVVDALTFLKGAKFVEEKPHALGASPFFQVTSAGVQAHERGTLNQRPL